MAFWDLSKTDRDDLQRKLRQREAMLKHGLNPPSWLSLEHLCAKYSLTEADMRACLKGLEK